MILILASLGGLMMILSWAKGRFGLHPEIARKLLHVGMGVITCSLPWLFESIWPVLLLALIAGGAMISVRKVKLLRGQVGGVLHDVGRDNSLGELFFPLGVALLFVVAHGSPLFYCLPLLVLTLADTVAALVGGRFGTQHYRLGRDQKSVEGSAAFFATTVICALVGLAFFTTLSLTALLWVALYFGLMMTFVEAISWSGSDNLTIPLGGFLALSLLLPLATMLSTPQLILGSAMVVGLATFVWGWSHRDVVRWLLVRQPRGLTQGGLLAFFMLFRQL